MVMEGFDGLIDFRIGMMDIQTDGQTLLKDAKMHLKIVRDGYGEIL